ncbi:putative aliphatic sulfonates transport permease protein SsuC [Oxobacter pfennigii]|uniref:Putative aliphatic sulfonates transport permease protein SsuC n=1 Tax=Oxobacter pfennigii TaxID=36849 RepID=A0A0P8Y718_9CLOT|nr:ABC transporter permease [Oxobacter pfennigii]KPU42237.1 putative aliphatic sulfonates transport permease protein SsuC [Oxobacter pfennigii]
MLNKYSGLTSKDNISTEHRNYLKKIHNRNTLITVTRVLLLIFFLVLWEIAGLMKWIDPFLISQPTRMVKVLFKLYNEGTLFHHIWVTCMETVVGFVAGTLLGTAIAIILWWSEFICKVLDPYLVVLNSLPKTALIPVLIFWIGNGQPAIITTAIFVSVVVTIMSVLIGFQEVDEDKKKLLYVFGATKLQILHKVILPSSVPNIISTLKINVGLSWVGVIVGEFLVAREGLGFLIVYGGQVAQLDMVMMSIIILSIAAYMMYIIVSYIEKYYMKWKQ